MNKPQKIPPPIIADNDRVLLCYAWLDDSVGYTEGHGLFFVDGKEIGKVPGLAICEDKRSHKPTLYYCDENWRVLGLAANYESVDAAKRRAEKIYPGVTTRWVEAHFTDKDVERYFAATSFLVSAAKSGDVTTLRVALASGADIDGRDNDGWTALFHAASQGNLKLSMYWLRPERSTKTVSTPFSWQRLGDTPTRSVRCFEPEQSFPLSNLPRSVIRSPRKTQTTNCSTVG
jgi:hypothetical protein